MGRNRKDGDSSAETLDKLRRRIAELEQAEKERDELRRSLEERTKEMGCLYAISRLRNERDLSVEELLQEILYLLPAAWQYPEVACARLTLPGKRVFCSRDFLESAWMQRGEVRVDGALEGHIEVFYRKEMPEQDEGPFLWEERTLLEAVCERVGNIIRQGREEARHRQQELQLQQLDKLAALGTLVSGVAHEINNPNSFIMLNAPILKEAFEDILPILDAYAEEAGNFSLCGLPYDEMRRDIPMLFSGIREGANRIKSIVESLKGFARSETRCIMEPVDLNAVVKTALALVNNLARRATKRFQVQYGGHLPRVKGNFQRLEQVVINLVQNACEALEHNGQAVCVTTYFDDSEGRVVVEVRDEGAGMSPECLRKMTDPFFTTKRHLGGTGLGLSVSSSIVEDHQGFLEFTSKPGEGTTARLMLPRANRDDNNNGTRES